MDPHLFEAVPDALVIVDARGCIVRANGKAHAMFGLAQGALDGQEVDALLPTELRGRHRAHRARYLQDPHVRPMGTTSQLLVGQRADGTRFPVEIALSPLMHGGAPHVLASIRDITDTQRERQALARARYDTIAAQVGHLAIELGGPGLFDALVGLLASALGALLTAGSATAQQPQQGPSAPPDVPAVEATETPEQVAAKESWTKGRPITMQYYRPQDRRGLNVFETTKDPGAEFKGVKFDFGAAFTSQVQSLSHSNAAAPK